MALSSLNATFAFSFKWVASNNLTGTDYQAVSNSGNLAPSENILSTVANASAGGGDELVSYIITIANSGNSTVDLTSLTDILQTAGVNLARVKGWMIRLLSTDDDATNGTNCTSITVGNAASNQWNMNLGTNATATIKNGGFFGYCDPTAAGETVNATKKNLYIVNNDSGNSAAVQISLVGGTS